MSHNVRYMHNRVNSFCASDALEKKSDSLHHVCMSRTVAKMRVLKKTYIRQWRKHRRLTLEKLAERLEISHTTLGRIERATIPYNQRFLEAAADALQCTPADLIMRDPTDSEGIWSIWDGLSMAQKRQAVAVIQAMRGTEPPEDTPVPGGQPPFVPAKPFPMRRSG